MLVALFALGAVAANVYPLADDSQSVVLTAIHLPIALWLVVGLAYVADDWRSSAGAWTSSASPANGSSTSSSSPSAAVC